MHHRDQIALTAASAQIRLVNWIADHPHQPVPAEIVRLSMETMADFFLERIIARLEFNPSDPAVIPDASSAELLEPGPTAPSPG